jgi:hypothetical protein
MVGRAPIAFLFLARPPAMGPYTGNGPEQPGRVLIGAVHHEIARVLHRFCPDRHGGGLPDWASGRAMVGGGEFTGVPCVLFLRFLGRLAAGSASDLILAVPSALFRNRRDGLWVSPTRDEAQRLETWRNVMTDPRFTDPRLSDPVVRRDESAAGGMWGWIAGVAVLLLIGFLIIAGWNNNTNTASSGSSTTASSSTAPKMTPPASTTGAGSSSTQPLAPPAPSAPPTPPKSQ